MTTLLTASPALNATDSVTTAIGWVAGLAGVPPSASAWVVAIVVWLFANWGGLGALAALAVSLYQSMRARQWLLAVSIAGEVTYNLAVMTELNNRGKREQAVHGVYERLGAVGRWLFTEDELGRIVEEGWKLIAKPKLAGEAS